MIGMRWRIAISWARRIFLIVSGRHAPAPQACDDSGGRCLLVVLVPRDEQADLDPGSLGIEQGGDALAGGELPLIVLALDPLRPASLFEARAELAVLVTQRLEATHAATCSAAHSSRYLMRSDVGVPGPKSLPVPCPSSAVMSSAGIIPPPVSSTSWRPAASSSLRTRGNSVMWAPDRIESPTTSTSSWIAAWAIISGVWCNPV